MAKEFMKRKIRVNAILPAYVNTPMVYTTTTFRYNQSRVHCLSSRIFTV